MKITAPKKDKVAPWQAADAARLKQLFEGEQNTLSQLRFGSAFELGSAGMVWQYLNGHRPLNITAAVGFARGLGCKVEDFSPTLASKIVEAMAYASAFSNDADQDGTHLHRLSKVEVRLLTRFRLTNEEGRCKLLDVGDSVSITGALTE